MSTTVQLQPADEDGAAVDLEAISDLVDEDGWVDLDKSWRSLAVILEALDVPETDRFLEEVVDAEVVAELARVLDKHPWTALFAKKIVEEDDLPDDLEYVEPYYDALRAVAHACAEEGVGWVAEML